MGLHGWLRNTYLLSHSHDLAKRWKLLWVPNVFHIHLARDHSANSLGSNSFSVHHLLLFSTISSGSLWLGVELCLLIVLAVFNLQPSYALKVYMVFLAGQHHHLFECMFLQLTSNVARSCVDALQFLFPTVWVMGDSLSLYILCPCVSVWDWTFIAYSKAGFFFQK